MSFQDKTKIKASQKKNILNQDKQQPRTSLLINSSFNIESQQNISNKQITMQVLKKVSETIVSLHSTLVPKTQNIEIYRDLSDEEQKMLKRVQDNKLIHTILAGVLAIDSCLKYIHRQETYVISSLMKGVSICLGNYKKVQEQFMQRAQGKNSQNFLKFYDSLKLIISQIHKIPAAKIKKTQIQKHKQMISKARLDDELINTLNRQQNLLFAYLAQQNNSQRMKINELQKQIIELQRSRDKMIKSSNAMEISQKKKRQSQNQTGSQSLKGVWDENQIKDLKEELMQKNDIILKMNDQFSLQIEKYQKVFKRLEQQNRILKKYNDLDTAAILQQLQFQVQRLRQQKRNDQNIINQIMQNMDRMSWNRLQLNSKQFQNSSKPYSSRYQTLFGGKSQFIQQIKRNRVPSVSPKNKEYTGLTRYFSPTFQTYGRVNENENLNIRNYEVPQWRRKQSKSPRFGEASQQNERVSREKLRKMKQTTDTTNKYRKQSTDDILQMRKSRLMRNNMKVSGIEELNLGSNMDRNIERNIDRNVDRNVIDRNIEMNKLRSQMRKSKFLNQQFGFLH